MPEWPEELMAGLDAPRPLAPELRARIEHALADEAGEIPSPRPLDEDLSVRLEDVLADTGADALVAALAEAGQPRPLRPTARRRIEKALGARRRSWVPGAAVAAGALVLAGVALGLGLSAGGAGPSSPGNAALPARLNTPSTSAPAPLSTGTSPMADNAGPTAQPQASSGLSSNSASAPATPAASATATAPAVDGVDPGSGPAAGGNWVIVSGSDLAGATAVDFDTTSAPFQVLSSSQLRVLAPAHAPGTVDVRVTTAEGTSPPGGPDLYTYR